MPLPNTVTTITVTGLNLCDSAGVPYYGTVTFTPASLETSGTVPIVIGTTPIVQTVTNGVMQPVVLATNDADLSPSNSYYTVTQAYSYNPGDSISIQQKYVVQLLGSMGSTVDLGALIPVTAPPAVVTYLLAANNLSDVPNKETAFNNLSPLTTLGDTLYGGTSGAATRLAGNTSTTKKFLTQAGNGSASAAPAWGTVSASDIPLPVDWLNVKNAPYGAAGNGVLITDASMTASSTTLTTAGQTTFTSGDVGKIVVVMGANTVNGSLGTPLAATISAYISATQVTLSVSAVSTVSSAVCYYGTDDHAALSAAYTATPTGGTAFHPYGIYMTSAALQPGKILRLTGNGATIVSTQSSILDFQNTYFSAASGSSTTTGIEIDHLYLDASGGHCLENTNWNKFTLHELRLEARSYNYGIWNSTAQNLLDTDIRNVVTRVHGNPRTVQSWYLKSALGGGIAMLRAQNCLFQNADLDTTQYNVWIECEDATNHSYTNDLKFEHCWFDSAYGGCVKLIAAQGATFQSCNIIDSYSATWGNSAYYIGAATSNGLWASQKISFRDCGRDLSGPNGTASWDIEVESTTDSVLIESYAIRDTVQPPTNTKPQFNLHGCTNATLINNKYRLITNPATTGVEILDGTFTYTGTLSGANQPNTDLPQHHGWRSWPYDLKLCNSTANLTAGVLAMVMQYINDSGPITGVVFNLTTAPTTPTSGENFAVLIDQTTGNIVAQSADMTTTISTSGVKKIPFTSTFTPVAGRLYWAAVLPNFSAGTFTLARLSNANGPLNSGQGATNYEYATNGTLQTSPPASITPSSNGAGGGAWWIGTY
jgi:hypothetical protein